MFRNFGAPEILLILLVIVLLFGARKLPETARGLGRSLRIFKAETKGLTDDDKPDRTDVEVEPRQVEARPPVIDPDPLSPGTPDNERREV